MSYAVLDVLKTCIHENVNYVKFERIIRDGLLSSHMSRAQNFLDFWEQSETARKAYSDSTNSTSMEDTARQTRSRLTASNYLGDEVSPAKPILVGSYIDTWEPQTSTSDSPSLAPQSPETRASHLETSPVNSNNAGESPESAEPQLPDVQPELREDQIIDEISRAHDPINQRDHFRMIANIRSSSPINTSGRLGYDTPLHLRRLQSLHRGSEIPLTPILAPAENDEGFIGSSPTPATRDPTPAMSTVVPVLKHQDITMTDTSDLPSSPPGLDSRSPSPNKSSRRKGNKRRRSAKAKEVMHRRAAEKQHDMNSPAPLSSSKQDAPEPAQSNEPEDPKENNAADQSDERPPSRRTRSALGQGALNDQSSGPVASIETPAKHTGSPSVQGTKSKSASKKGKKRRNSTKPTNEESEQAEQADANLTPAPAPAPAPASDYSMDSSGEDVETQIASQLEQDLELAVDLRENFDELQREERPRSPMSTKKRKRDNESRTPTAKDRRRSSRLSSTNDISVSDANEVDASPVTLLSPTLRRSTRGSQRNSEAVSQIFESTQEHGEDEETPRPPSKRSRRSLGLEDESTQANIQGNSSSVRSTRDTPSRQTRSSRRQSKVLKDDQDDQDIPDSLPLVSTEEVTDSQMTDMASSNDVQMNIDVHISSQQQPSVVIEKVENISHAEYHTTPKLPQSDSTEEGIAESLRKLLGDMKSAALGPDALRKVDDLLFNIRIEAHAASNRYSA